MDIAAAAWTTLAALLAVYFRWVLPEPEGAQQEGEPWEAPEA